MTGILGTRDFELPTGVAAPTQPRPLSEVFLDLAGETEERVSIRDLVDVLRDRSFAPLLIVLAIPNIIPFIPGSSTVLGLLLALMSIQLVLGFSRVWLPGKLNDWSFERKGFRGAVQRIAPNLRRIERMARPRYWPASYRLAERVAGAVALLLSLMIMLPIPLANALPALAICLLAIGISERDGLWLGAGVLVGAIATGVVAGIFLAGFAAATTIW